jgi:hypothetical protein
MPVYQTSSHIRYTPRHEIVIARNGALLSRKRARYATLDEYVDQYAAPLSMLSGMMTFSDPMCPELTLLVQCSRAHLCDQCGETEADCHCAF